MRTESGHSEEELDLGGHSQSSVSTESGPSVKSMIKFQIKKMLCLSVAVGHVKMMDDELVYNIHLLLNFWCHCTRKTSRMSSLCTLRAP